jgi:hypothetical protein
VTRFQSGAKNSTSAAGTIPIVEMTWITSGETSRETSAETIPQTPQSAVASSVYSNQRGIGKTAKEVLMDKSGWSAANRDRRPLFDGVPESLPESASRALNAICQVRCPIECSQHCE